MPMHTYYEYEKQTQCQYNHLMLILIRKVWYGKRPHCVKVWTNNKVNIGAVGNKPLKCPQKGLDVRILSI